MNASTLFRICLYTPEYCYNEYNNRPHSGDSLPLIGWRLAEYGILRVPSTLKYEAPTHVADIKLFSDDNCVYSHLTVLGKLTLGSNKPHSHMIKDTAMYDLTRSLTPAILDTNCLIIMKSYKLLLDLMAKKLI
jgi:hypothetical protein